MCCAHTAEGKIETHTRGRRRLSESLSPVWSRCSLVIHVIQELRSNYTHWRPAYPSCFRWNGTMYGASANKSKWSNSNAALITGSRTRKRSRVFAVAMRQCSSSQHDPGWHSCYDDVPCNRSNCHGREYILLLVRHTEYLSIPLAIANREFQVHFVSMKIHLVATFPTNLG